MTNKRLSIVQKVRYGVLVIPIAFLLLSLLAVIGQASPHNEYVPVQDVKDTPSVSEIFNVVAYGLCTVWILLKILHQLKNQVAVSAELKSAFAFFLGLAMMWTSARFSSWQFLSYVGIGSLDIAAIIMLVTLLQGKSFGPLTLYHKDVQIEKIS